MSVAEPPAHRSPLVAHRSPLHQLQRDGRRSPLRALAAPSDNIQGGEPAADGGAAAVRKLPARGAKRAAAAARTAQVRPPPPPPPSANGGSRQHTVDLPVSSRQGDRERVSSEA